MEKQRVNDAVVKLGNLIVKARVHVAHRLSSKIRALRGKKNEKSSKRIERLILEIAYLKTLSRSGTRKAVARKMLLSADDLAAKIELESTAPEERAFCRLCKTKFIENFISKFREENVDWKYWVPPLLAMWDKKVEMKKTRISKPESDEPKRQSAREIAEARKRRAGSDDVEDDENRGKRAKREVAREQTNTKRESKAASTKFKIEPMPKSKVSLVPVPAPNSDESDSPVLMNRKKPQQVVGSDSDDRSEDERGSSSLEAESDGKEEILASPDKSHGSHDPNPYRGDYNVSESSDSEDRVSNDGDEDSQSDGGENRRGSRKGNTASESEKDEETGDDEHDEESERDVKKDCGEVEDSDDDEEEDDGEVEDSEDDEGESDEKPEGFVSPSSKTSGPGISVKQLEKVLDRDIDEEDPDEDQDEDDSSEEADDDEDVESDSVEDDSDRERKFEQRIVKKFKFNGARELDKVKIPVSSYEPESSEEEFPTAQKANSSRKDQNGDDEAGDDAPASSSFFLRKGEQPEDVQSRTIPKEKAPGMNRRQRRGHEKQRSFNTSDQDDSDEAQPRSSMTFGKDFRPRKSFPHQDRSGTFQGKRHFERNPSGPRGFPNERFNKNGHHQPGRNPRASLPGRFEKSSAQDNRRRSTNFPGDKKFEPRGNREERRPGFGGNNGGGFDQKNRRFSERPERPGQMPTDRDRREQRPERTFGPPQRNRTQDTPRAGTEEKLHPSWLAKKKLSASINQPFQGKKIVFDD